ncbi:leucine-rich repeat protein [Alistipes putredinis]|uniref:leucine-rich repeat domain-containing protein n=1 Tax=Alistipes putredinis TaxID=28117 RepID=UPI003AABD494
MKNYLYILCAFLLAFAGCTKDADVEPIAPAPDGNTQVVLTGFSGRGTRTGFGGAEDGAVPFLWSAGDYIWARNTRSEAIAEGGSQATFVFESLETADAYDVFYNLTGPAAATALIPAEQTQQAAGELNLGQNGDFGYATAQNGTFTLEHATSYVWFDTYSSDVTSNLLSITLSVSGGQTIAGEAAFADGKLGDCKGSSSVTLSFGEEGVALPSQSNDTDVFAAMVLYPADLSTATVSIVYKFADGSVYLQTKSGKTLTPGHTLRLSTQIAKADCKSSGAFFMTEAGVAEELPTEPIGYLKVVTLGESTLSAEELTSIAGNLANGAVIDLGETTFAATEFPLDFYRKTNLQEIALPRNIQTIADDSYSGAFYNCSNLKRVTLPEGLTAIGANCFRECSKLESIDLPSTVHTLGKLAFYNCKVLTSAVIPEGVETIPQSLFANCSALNDVTLPSTLKSIESSAFEKTGLKEITIPESVTTLEDGLFNTCKSLERVQLPDALTEIPKKLCYQCSALTTINMPSKVKDIGEEAFYQCSKLQDVTLPETLETIGARSFGGCNAFTRIVINIPEITEYSFWSCANVTSIDLGEKVTSIGRNAFITASNLQTITCRAKNAPSLASGAFGSAGSKVEGKKILYVPAASYDAYETAWTDVISQGYTLQDINDQQLTDGIYYRASREADWVPTLPATFTALYVRTVGDDAALTASQFNTIITKISAQSAPVTLDLNMAKFEATEFPTGLAGNAKLGTIKFFENTASIAAGAFKGCTALTKATVPTGVGTIGESTFEECTALAALTLPSSVKTIGDKAFKSCAALADADLASINSIGIEAFAGTGLTSAKIYATTLGEKSFRDCTELTAITLGSATTIPAEMFAGCTAITTVTIPASVQTIGASAFEGCSKLATLTLGSGVTTLGDRAFADCGLTALALPDNVTTLGDGAFSNNPNIATLQFGAGLTAISDNAFATNDAIENLTIPKTIVTIGAGSFSDWSKLTKLTISGNTLTSIGSKAFENAALLADVYAEPTTAPAVQADSFSGAGTSVQGSKTFHVASVEAYSSWTTAASGYTMEALGPDYLSEGLYYRASGEDPWKSEIPQTFTTLYVKTVGDNTVMTAAQMKSVADAVLALAAPATVDFSEVVYESTTFPNSFKSNANLAGIVFPQNVTATASAAFQKTGMTSVTVLKDISYGSNAFDSCASLVSVTVEEGVTEIGNYMFQNTKLTDVTLPNSVTKIGASAFNGCSLTTINFGQGVKTIENSAFQNCGELTEIILPDATETLGQNAFGDCPKLAKISLGKNMKTLEAYCFVGYSKGCPLLGDIICRATTPPTLKDDYGTGPFGGGWSPVAGKDVPAENRIIHLPKSADLVGGTGAYADSSWVKLTSSTYGFAFKYDVEG